MPSFGSWLRSAIARWCPVHVEHQCQDMNIELTPVPFEPTLQAMIIGARRGFAVGVLATLSMGSVVCLGQSTANRYSSGKLKLLMESIVEEADSSLEYKA